MNKIIVVGIVTMTLTGAVFAATKAENFAKWDKNKDGLLQKEEYMAMRAKWGKDVAESEKSFKWLDKDNDGALTKKEFGITEDEGA